MPGGMHAAVRRKLKRLETQKALGGEIGKKAALEIAVILNASTTNEAYPDKKIVNGRPNQKKSPDLQRSRKNLQLEVKPKVATVPKKKPKHLKRKLEQLSSSAEGDDGQREKTAKELKAQMEAWEQTKKERMKKFEAIVESAAGDFFNKERFDELVAQGISKEKIVDALKAQHEGPLASFPRGEKLNPLEERTELPNSEVTEVESNKPVQGSSKVMKHVDSGAQKSHSHKKRATTEHAHSSTDTKENTTITYKNNRRVDSSNTKVHNADESPTNQEVSKSDESDSDSDSSHAESGPAGRVRGSRNKARARNQSQIEPQVQSNLTRTNIDKEESSSSACKEAAISLQNDIKKKDTRRCIGRKPVTDFELWKSYQGKVVYLKPFGAFLDIGCHSDAFCHISRVQDDFVENIESVLSEGDIVTCRVVEIDREKKRITVSMQSEKMIETEKKLHSVHQLRLEKTRKSNEALSDPPIIPKTKPSDKLSTNKGTQPKDQVESMRNVLEIDDSMLDKAELKRKRKLERRVQRRVQASTEED